MSFSKDETIKSVIEIVQQKLRLPDGTVTLNSSFKDLGADSLDIVDMIMEFEESFGIHIDDEDAEKIATVDEVVNHIHQMRTK
jgi:acyl carrier protein